MYITASRKAKPQRLDDIRKFKADKFTFYGSLQTPEMLKQFNDKYYVGFMMLGYGSNLDCLFKTIFLVNREPNLQIRINKRRGSPIFFLKVKR